MNIYKLILGNTGEKPITRRFPEVVTPPPDFRGLVQIDTSKCIGCGICAYVCTDGSIQMINHSNDYEWRYDPGLCTFCERCVYFCPVDALSMKEEAAPSYTKREDVQEVYTMQYPSCPECGRPAYPVSEKLLTEIFGKITDDMRNWIRLCDRCRRRTYQRILKDSFKEGKRSHGL